MEENKLLPTLDKLPKGYKLSNTVDLEDDKKKKLFVNLFAVLLGVALIVPMVFLVPIEKLFDLGDFGGMDIFLYVLRFLVLILGFLVYVILHELTHALFMKIFGSKKVSFGFTGIYAYAGSDTEYFKKWPYIIVALAPLVVFFVIFAIVCPLIYKTSWFWIAYLISVQNICGSVGDVYVFFRFLREPRDSYIKDNGTKMELYSKKTND